MTLTRETVDLDELLTDVAVAFDGQAEKAGIDLKVEQTAEGPLAVTADAGRMQQVLGNLVVNALRHTKEGGSVTLRASGTPDGVRIQVTDTGEGISAEDIPFIFDRFWRGDQSRTRSSNAGGGLGLAIARQMILAHDGEITVDSDLGRGTTFTIGLPFE